MEETEILQMNLEETWNVFKGLDDNTNEYKKIYNKARFGVKTAFDIARILDSNENFRKDDKSGRILYNRFWISISAIKSEEIKRERLMKAYMLRKHVDKDGTSRWS